MAKLFRPPTRTVKYRSGGRLFGRLPRHEGVTLLKVGGLYRQAPDPRAEDVRDADAAYLGGRVYTVSDTTAVELSTAGYDDCLSPEDTSPPQVAGLEITPFSQKFVVMVRFLGPEVGTLVTAVYGGTEDLGSEVSLDDPLDGVSSGAVEGLAPWTSYYVRVRAVDAAGNTVVFPPLDQPPRAVSTMSHTAAGFTEFSDGFEAGDLGAWPTVTGAASAATGAAYAGSYGARLSPSASAGSIATSTTKWPQLFCRGVASFRFRFNALPSSGSADIATLRNTAGSGHADFFVHSNGNFWFDLVGGLSEVDTGVAADAGVWHEAQIKVDYGSDTHRAWLLLDGVEHEISQDSAVESFVRSFHLGTTSAKTYEFDVDSVRVLVGVVDPGWGVV